MSEHIMSQLAEWRKVHWSQDQGSRCAQGVTPSKHAFRKRPTSLGFLWSTAWGSHRECQIPDSMDTKHWDLGYALWATGQLLQLPRKGQCFNSFPGACSPVGVSRCASPSHQQTRIWVGTLRCLPHFLVPNIFTSRCKGNKKLRSKSVHSVSPQQQASVRAPSLA